MTQCDTETPVCPSGLLVFTTQLPACSFSNEISLDFKNSIYGLKITIDFITNTHLALFDSVERSFGIINIMSLSINK